MCKFRNYDNYEIYADGSIWSYKRNKWLKPKTRKDDYKEVYLVDNEGKKKMYRLHRVVFETFSGSPIPEGMQVNHINEDKTDNRFDNLNLMTPKENVNWGSGIERRAKSHSKTMKGIIPKANPPKQVGAFKDGELIMTFPSTNEAGRQGFKQGNVSKCCRNCFNREGNNVYKGFEWRYI